MKFFPERKGGRDFYRDGPFCLEEEPKVQANIISLDLLFGLDYESWGERRLGKRYMDETQGRGYLCSI